MRVHIFDVEHGECNVIEMPSGDLVMIGAGHNSSTGWRPSAWLRQRNAKPSWLVASNLDRDHLSDLPNFEPALRPTVLVRNKSLDTAWVRQLKVEESGMVHPAVEQMLDWMDRVYNGASIAPAFGLECKFFAHSPATFQDTNNLSVVTFLSYGGCGLLFPGDLEAAGWRAFLANPAFVDCLSRTKILVASHHGRSGGYCAEAFAAGRCWPDCVIMSDKAREHDTQEHDSYGQHCKGVYFGPQRDRRLVLTTRNDGKITIDVPEDGDYRVHINQAY